MNWIYEWALVRQSEMAYISDEKLNINPDFLQTLTHEEFETAFRDIGKLIHKIYGDIEVNPEKFSLPVYDVEKYGYASNQARASWRAPWEPIQILMSVSLNEPLNKITKLKKKFDALTEYGFIITQSAAGFNLEYPDNPNVVTVLKLVAEKSRGFSHYSNPFYSWNPRILYSDDINDFNTLYDKMKDEADRTFVMQFHEKLVKDGYSFEENNWNEGPGIRYHKRSKNEPYDFRMLKNKFTLQLMVRIRNAEKCMDYVSICPESIKDIFRSNDNGCANKHKGCNKGVGYVFEGEEKWKCGCCNAPFVFHPIATDIPHYIKLIELGKNK
jgi:hypothetical protein